MVHRRSNWGCALAGVFLLSGVARAGVVRYVDAHSPAVAPDGMSWCTAHQNLQTALLAAQAGDEIRVADGVYKPVSPPVTSRVTTFQLKSDVAVYGGYAGCGAADPDLRDYAAFESILSGDLNGDDGPGFTNNAENSYHVVSGWGANAGAILDGFTVTAGNANGSNPQDRGGGIFNYFVPGSPTYRNLVIRGNYAAVRGGGVYNDVMTGTYANCLITGNLSGMWGGGMYNNFGTNITAPLIIHCTIAGNHAEATGGMYNTGPTRPTVVNTILWGNTHAGPDEAAQITPADGGVHLSYSVVDDFQGQFFTGVGNVDADPLFVDPDGADNISGNADDDYRLAATSSAINAGDPAEYPITGVLDLEYAARVRGCRADAGAFEHDIVIDPGDIDADGVLTLMDHAFFALCFAAPAGNLAWSEVCLCVFDSDANNVIDADDHAAFMAAFSGP